MSDKSTPFEPQLYDFFIAKNGKNQDIVKAIRHKADIYETLGYLNSPTYILSKIVTSKLDIRRIRKDISNLYYNLKDTFKNKERTGYKFVIHENKVKNNEHLYTIFFLKWKDKNRYQYLGFAEDSYEHQIYEHGFNYSSTYRSNRVRELIKELGTPYECCLMKSFISEEQRKTFMNIYTHLMKNRYPKCEIDGNFDDDINLIKSIRIPAALNRTLVMPFILEDEHKVKNEKNIRVIRNYKPITIDNNPK